MHSFTFGGKNILQFGGRILQAPFHTIARRNIELVKIYGQSGDEIIDNESYDNVPFSLKICFMPLLTQKTAKELAYAVIDWLAPLQNSYYEYRDTYNPGYFTKAVLTNFESVQRELRTLLTATLEFSRVPFWYSDGGQVKKTISSSKKGTVLINPEAYESEPLWEFTFSPHDGNDVLTIDVNGIETIVDININNCVYYFDTPNKQFYYLDNGEKIYLGDTIIPNLCPGENKIVYELETHTAASETSLRVLPNWGRL